MAEEVKKVVTPIKSEEPKKNSEIKIESLKAYIKNLAKDEKSLKSISFSSNEEKKEFICYFAWQQELYSKFFVERDIFRKQIISYLEKYGYRLNKRNSTAAKYVFNG